MNSSTMQNYNCAELRTEDKQQKNYQLVIFLLWSQTHLILLLKSKVTNTWSFISNTHPTI